MKRIGYIGRLTVTSATAGITTLTLTTTLQASWATAANTAADSIAAAR